MRGIKDLTDFIPYAENFQDLQDLTGHCETVFKVQWRYLSSYCPLGSDLFHEYEYAVSCVIDALFKLDQKIEEDKKQGKI